MPFQYSIVFEIVQTLQKEELNHLQRVESGKSVEEIVSKEIDSWCDLTFTNQNIFTDLTSTSKGEKRISYQAPTSETTKSSEHLSVDWRLGSIDLSGIDMEEPNNVEGGNGNIEGTAPRPTRSKSFSRGLEYLKGRFMGYGVIRLYKDSELVDENGIDEIVEEDDRLYEKPGPRNKSEGHQKKTKNNSLDVSKAAASISDNTVLAILAVPSYLAPYDFLGFIGYNARENISHFRMIRTAVANRYMVLMKFRSEDRAAQFYKDYNGKLFNSMEAETCHVVFVSSVQFKTDQNHPQGNIPYLLRDPFTMADEDVNTNEKHDNDNDNENNFSVSNVSNEPVPRNRRISQVQTRRPVPPPTPALTELPTCPVCLERMDSTITGLLTIPCQHTFHCQCLSKWQDGSCPVCRYSQRGTTRASLRSSNCAVCHASENLWICLICGHIGCGRYDQAHAYDHYVATGHCYAMDTESQRVWDYVSDGYVHRLLQNEVDGKLVELPSPMGSSSGPRGNGGGGSQSSTAADVAAAAMKAAETSEKKLDDVGLQFAQMLSSQLDSQRDYYETLMATAADKASMATRRASAAEAENAQLRTDHGRLKDEVLPKLERDLEKTKTRADKLQHLYQDTLHKFDEEKVINEYTCAKLKNLEGRWEEKLAEVEELQEQVRDLMFFHEAQAKLQDAGSDVQEGQIIIGPKPSSSKKKGKKKK